MEPQRLMTRLIANWERCPQFLQYLIIGGINTLFGYGIFCLLIYMAVHYSVAILISTVLGVLFNFQTTGRLVFQSKDFSRVGRFLMVYLVLYITNVLWLWLVVKMGFSPYVGGALAILPIACLGYLLNKKFVF